MSTMEQAEAAFTSQAWLDAYGTPCHECGTPLDIEAPEDETVKVYCRRCAEMEEL